MSETEALLWRSWRERRDARAFEVLVRPHLGFVAAFARRLGWRADDVDEVVQRALVALATEPREKPVAVGLRAWLGRSVMTASRMLARADRRRGAREARAVRAPAVRVDPLEVRDDVEAALARLSPDDRRLVELRFLHDLEYREVAFITGRSALACRLRVHRALARLRREAGRDAALVIAAVAPAAAAPPAATSVARALEAAAHARRAAPATAASAGAHSIEGSLAMGSTGKFALAAGVALLLAGGGWWLASGREGDAPSGTTRVPVVAARPTTEAPPRLAVGGGRPRAEGAAVPAVGPAGAVADASARGGPVDAPIARGMGAVTGTIRFDDGTPLSAARVALTIVPTEAGASVATTDAEGRFHLDDAWVGERPLTLVHADGTVLILRSVALVADARVVADVVLARGVTLAGVVRDAGTRAPTAGAWVTLRRPAASYAQAGYGGAVTDASGRFRFEHVPPARVTVEVVSGGRTPRLEALDVGSADVALDLALEPARALIVRYEPVPREAVGGRMAWSLSGPITSPEQLHQGSRGNDRRAVLSEAGELRLDAPPPGRYQLILFETDVLPRLDTEVVVTEAEVPVVRVPVPPGGRVVGTLLDAAGQPVVGRTIGVGGVSSAATDTDGRFALPRVKAGARAVSVLMSGCWVRVATVEIGADRETVVPLRLPGTSGLAWTVDSPPIGAYATLSASDGTTAAEGSVGDHEDVALVGLGAGRYRLKLQSMERTDFERDVTLEVGKTLELGRIGPTAMPVVPVRVVLPPGVARPAMITVLERRKVPELQREVLLGAGRIEFDAEGRAWLRGLPAGRHHVFLQAAQAMTEADLTEVDLDVRDGITVPIEITIRR